MRYLSWVAAVTVALAACTEAPTANNPADEAEAAVVLALPDIRLGTTRQQAFQEAWNPIRVHSAIERQQLRVITSSAIFDGFWAHATSWVSPAPPVPFVQFESEMVLLAAYGSVTAGHWVEIKHVALRERRIVVVVERVHSGAGCVSLAVMTSPTAAVVVPRRGDPVRFIVLNRTRNCE